MLLTILQSCRSTGYPRINDVEQLSPYFEYVTIDGKEYIDIDKSTCLARMYRHEKGYIGSVSEAQTLDIKYCNKVIGYAPVEYGEYTTWKENMRNWIISQE